MKVCRACGRHWCDFEDQNESKNKYANIYLHLTAIQLLDCIELNLIVFCADCIAKLDEFDVFRQNCLDVHQRLQVKVEVWQEDEPTGEVCIELETLSEDPEEELLYYYDTSDHELETGEICVKVETLSEASEEEFQKDQQESSDFNADTLPIDTSVSDASDHDEESVTEQPKKLARVAKKKSSKVYFSCTLCPKKFVAQHTLDAHLRVHQGLKPFLCEVCGRDFRSLRHKKAHLEQHTDGYTRATCDYPGCGQILVNELGLQDHWARFHKPNNKNNRKSTVMCNTCGKSFTSNGALKRHKYLHNPEEMPFACDMCGKKFTTKHKLQVHKNFVYSLCGLRKTSKDELRNHIKRVHERQKKKRDNNRTCDLCGNIFSQKAALKRHANTVHLGIKQYVCTTCGSAFGQREHLKRHMQTKHRNMR